MKRLAGGMYQIRDMKIQRCIDRYPVKRIYWAITTNFNTIIAEFKTLKEARLAILKGKIPKNEFKEQMKG